MMITIDTRLRPGMSDAERDERDLEKMIATLERWLERRPHPSENPEEAIDRHSLAALARSAAKWKAKGGKPTD
jgi:hypothetical protein